MKNLKNSPKIEKPRDHFIYDGDCGFCSRSTKLVAGKNPRFNIVVSANCVELLATHNVDKRLTQEVAIWISSSGEVKLGAFAIAAALKKGNLLKRILGTVVETFPINYLAKVIYRQIAKRRKFLWWGEYSCTVIQESTAESTKMELRLESTSQIFLTWQFLLPSVLYIWRLIPGEGVVLYGWGWQMFS